MSIKSKTHKGTGFNELRFEDEKGKEEVFIHAEKDYRRLIKNNEIVKIEGELKVNVIGASEKKAKAIQVTANDFMEFNLGANQIKMTPTQITVAGKKVSIKGQAMTSIQGGMVKINADGGGASQAKASLEKMAVEAKVGEFDGFGINKSVKPVQVASSGSNVPDDFGSGAIEPLFFPADMLGDFSPKNIVKNMAKKVFGKGDKSDDKGKNVPKTSSLDPNDIRFSQNTVSYNKIDRKTGKKFTYDDLVKNMKKDGWKGDPVDVIKMPDGKITSMDNTRILAAREAGIEVKATVRQASDNLNPKEIERFSDKKKGFNPKTWGEAMSGRINKQKPKSFPRENPSGSIEPPRVTGKPK